MASLVHSVGKYVGTLGRTLSGLSEELCCVNQNAPLSRGAVCLTLLIDCRIRATPLRQGFEGSHLYNMSATISSATMLTILIIGLMAGPAVSLYGSPTVSPVTAAW